MKSSKLAEQEQRRDCLQVFEEQLARELYLFAELKKQK